MQVAGDAVADYNDALLEARCRSLQGRSHLPEQRRMHDDRDGTALLEKIRVVGASQARVGRHGYGAYLHGTQECGDELGGIEEDQQDACARANAKGRQRVRDAAHVLGYVPRVRDLMSLGHNGQAIAAPFPDMAIDEVVREVYKGPTFSRTTPRADRRVFASRRPPLNRAHVHEPGGSQFVNHHRGGDTVAAAVGGNAGW